jgi:hypothetical protein
MSDAALTEQLAQALGANRIRAVTLLGRAGRGT